METKKSLTVNVTLSFSINGLDEDIINEEGLCLEDGFISVERNKLVLTVGNKTYKIGEFETLNCEGWNQ